jgi:hypothetical protein
MDGQFGPAIADFRNLSQELHVHQLASDRFPFLGMGGVVYALAGISHK